MKNINPKKFISTFLSIPLIVGAFCYILPAQAEYYVPDSEIVHEMKSAVLKLSYNDGIQCFINESLIINVLEEIHPGHYWDRKIDIYKNLKEDENLIACQIVNEVAGGNFDAEIVLNSEEIIKKGNSDYCNTSTYWKFYGESNSASPPPKDKDGDKWYQFGYNDDDWKYGPAPFGDDPVNDESCVKNILNHAPDNAWFRKKFFLNAEQLGLVDPLKSQPKDFFLGTYAQPTLVSLAENKDIKQHPNIIYYSKYQTPIFTGLTQYGSEVKIYIDNNFVNYATVQHGEKSGTANFYYWYKQYLTEGLHTVYTVSENPLTKFVSKPSPRLYFSIVPIKPATIISLAENKKVDMSKVYITNWQTPIITGLSPYGKEVNVYIDNEFAGKAITQEGEKSGTSNFYFKSKLLYPGRHTVVATSYEPRLSLESISRQVITFEVK